MDKRDAYYAQQRKDTLAKAGAGAGAEAGGAHAKVDHGHAAPAAHKAH